MKIIKKTSIRIRPATDHDISAILELETMGFTRAEERFHRRQIHSLIVNPRAKVLVAEDDKGTVLGWAAGLLRRYLNSNSGRLYAVAVHPHARGRHIGETLIEYIIHSLTKCNASRIYLEVNINNKPAINLYHKLGFTEQKCLVDYYGRGHHAIRMVRF